MSNETLQKIKIYGQSMSPFLKEGDELWLEEWDSKKSFDLAQIGDLFIYICNDKEVLCHRYLGKNKDQFIFKGDRSYSFESYKKPYVFARVGGLVVNEKKIPCYFAGQKYFSKKQLLLLQKPSGAKRKTWMLWLIIWAQLERWRIRLKQFLK